MTSQRCSRPRGKSNSVSYGVTTLCWVPVHMNFHVCPSAIESVSSQSFWNSCTQALLVLKTKYSGIFSSQCQIPRLGRLMCGSEFSLWWGEPLWYNHFPIWDLIIWNATYCCLIVASSAFGCKIFLWFQVCLFVLNFCMYGCSAFSCDFADFVKRRWAQVLLICHLVWNRAAAFTDACWLFPQCVPDTIPLIWVVAQPVLAPQKAYTVLVAALLEPLPGQQGQSSLLLIGSLAEAVACTHSRSFCR